MYSTHAAAPLTQQLAVSLDYLRKRITVLPEPYGSCVLFFTVAAEGEDACVFFVRRATLDAAWREGSTRVRQWAWVRNLGTVELRIDWPRDIAPFPSLPIPCWTADSASAWAIADDSLENAELIPPFELPCGSQAIQDLPPPYGQCSATDPPQKLLLRLQGLYMGEAATPVALPRVPWSMLRRNLHHAPLQQLPYRAAQSVLMQQQHAQGHWAETSLHDHLGITYALLLVHHHTDTTEPTHAVLAQGLKRAIGYLRSNMDTLLQPLDEKLVLQAQYLLVLARYAQNQLPANRVELQASMKPLVQALNFVRHSIDPCRSAWAELALNAYEQCQTGGSEQAVPRAAHAPLSLLRALEFLAQPFWQSINTPLCADHPAEAGDFAGERWHAIAMAEGALLGILPSVSHCRHADQWHTDLQRPVLSAMRQTIWPEYAIFLPSQIRRQAAFSSHPPLHGVVNSARATAKLLLTAYALLRWTDN